MATAPGRTYLSPDAYLAIERRSEEKHEYHRGEMFAMGGASRQHTLIVGNIAGELRERLRGRPCETYMLDMRVLVRPTGLFTYPDVTVVCGEPRFLDGVFDTLTNPTVIVEVLSPSTEAYDRGRKFDHYREIASLREYVLVAQDRMSISLYRREGDLWTLRHASDAGGVVTLEAIGCELPLAQVYERVEFPPEPPPPAR
jgi:Uma2 family endonuclease